MADQSARRVGEILGFGPRRPDPVVVGPAAYTRWWERGAAGVALVGLIVVLGLATAALIGAIFFVAGFVLEQVLG